VVGGSALFARCRRLCNDLRPNPSNVAECYGEPDAIARSVDHERVPSYLFGFVDSVPASRRMAT
jgi:hypothetical protein